MRSAAVAAAAVVLVLVLVSANTAAAARVQWPLRMFTPSSSSSSSSSSSGGDAGGGTTCATCTVLTGLLDRYAATHQTTIEKVLDDVCTWFPGKLRSTCEEVVALYGEQIVDLFAQGFKPDAICLKLKFCTDPTCYLFASPQDQLTTHELRELEAMRARSAHVSFDPFQWIKDLINRLANSHEPVVDIDDDNFSTFSELRGYDWRGHDCDDLDRDVYPGRANDGPNSDRDGNCNGVYGASPSKQSYEDLLCGNTGARGTVILGDSAGAHFSIPPSYVNASEMGPGTYNDLLEVLSDEFDWPHQSSTTGFVNVSRMGTPVDSLYLRMRNNNLCNHRDYQNVAVNGARVGAMADGIIKSLARKQTLDKPLLIVFALIGNDICTPHPSLDHMTTVEEFRASVLESLDYLKQTLPMGSHIVFTGLVDGRVLWDNLHNRTHPIGNIQYQDLYRYLNCLQISPCWAWLNENETVRNAGSQRAAELSAVYTEVMANYSAPNFDMAYYDFPLPDVIKLWQSMGGEIWELIEPVDGFHPNSIAQSLSAMITWEKLLKEHPTFVGPVNPNNALIAKLFGDQGGYGSK